MHCGGKRLQSSIADARLMLVTAMSPTEVTEKLGLMRMKDRSWYCHPSNAIDGDGLFEGVSLSSLNQRIRTRIAGLTRLALLPARMAHRQP